MSNDEILARHGQIRKAVLATQAVDGESGHLVPKFKLSERAMCLKASTTHGRHLAITQFPPATLPVFRLIVEAPPILLTRAQNAALSKIRPIQRHDDL
jgi:hypothetical protein